QGGRQGGAQGCQTVSGPFGEARRGRRKSAAIGNTSYPWVGQRIDMGRARILLVCATTLAAHATARSSGAGDPAQPVPVPAVAAKAAARPAWPDEQFERWVFSPHASAAEAQ